MLGDHVVAAVGVAVQTDTSKASRVWRGRHCTPEQHSTPLQVQDIIILHEA